MFWKYALLAILPTIVFSHINVHLKPEHDGISAIIRYFGQEVSVITDKEMEIYQLNNETLKNSSEVFMGKRCTDVFVKPPTPWGDVYAKYNWDIVKTTLQPLFGAVVGNSSETIVLGVQEYSNNFGKNNLTQKVNMSLVISENVLHNWTKGQNLGLGREIYYDINFADDSLGGSTSITYSAPWGESLFKTRYVTVGKNSSSVVTIPPGGKILATITAIQHTIEIQIIYQSKIDGMVFCNYEQLFNGHHFYAITLKELQHILQTPLSKFASEKITMKYYTDYKIVTSDGTQLQLTKYEINNL